ncbi:hypothetical protein LCGC14_2543850 [marine sediment metagenome]|uniref:Uncharacterized protein n=1 Tax=marine sediment metagenome TaxID=412755 RepID=A0A0F9D1F7_9ZZZZ
MFAKTVAGICPKHGNWKGERCSKCEQEDTAYLYKQSHTGDQMYKFTTEIGGKPVEINSKGQFNRLLKQNNLVHTVKSDLRGLKPGRIDTRRQSQKLADFIHSKGATNWCKGRENPSGPDRLGG